MSNSTIYISSLDSIIVDGKQCGSITNAIANKNAPPQQLHDALTAWHTAQVQSAGAMSIAKVQTALDTHSAELAAAVATAGDPATVLVSVKGLSDALNTQTSASRKAAHAKKLAEAQAALAKLQAAAPE
jgi:hypothetical protein